MDKKEILELRLHAARARRNVLRMVEAAHHGHMGGAMSAMDIVTALYFHTMNVRPEDPKWEDRDRFLLSAGHKCMVQYAILAERGFFDPAVLDTYGSLKSPIPGHPDMYKLPGVEANTGALGHGLSIASGMALGLRASGKDARVFTIMGDGELAEGSNWEAAMAGRQFGLDNLCAVVDRNRLQISGNTEDVMADGDLHARFESFGWHVIDLDDGNDVDKLNAAYDEAENTKGKPTVIIAETVKGLGSPLMENKAGWHHHLPNQEEYAQICRDLEERKEALRNE